MRKDWTRRDVLRGASAACVSISFPALLAACGSDEFTCTDLSGLSSADRQTRVTLVYLDRSPDPTKRCDNCRFFTSAGPKKCGGCQLIKGPIHPKGHCKSWAVPQPS